MKFKIDVKGNLFIERAGKYKAQLCPFSSAEFIPCGDWCPLFGELENHLESEPNSLELCHNVTLVGTYIDERN